MIYQLKITLQRTSPPIWRRLLVDSNMTLAELHETIQIAFDWLDMHLHCFEAKKTNGVSLTNRLISIGTDEEGFMGFGRYDYNETEEKVSDWLVKEKDKLVYVYDFGDDWRHEIVLEKVLKRESGMAYPYCVKAMRGPVEEDSGGFVDEVEEVDSKELQSMINMQLESMAVELSEGVWEQPIEQIGDFHNLLLLAKKFNELAPWRWLSDDQIFAVQSPQTGEYFYCSVMGALGEEFGLAAFRGEKGLQYLKTVLFSSSYDEDFIYQNNSIVLSFCNRDELEPEDYNLIKREGLTFRGKKQWPMLRSFVPGYYPWLLSDEEAEIFSVILERAIDICGRSANVVVIPEFDGEGECFAQSNVGGIWQDATISLKTGKAAKTSSKLHINELALQKIKANYRRFNVPLEIGTFFSPSPVQETPTERPYFPVVLVAAERKNGMIVSHEMFSQENLEKNIQTAFIDICEKLNAVPREIWIKNELHLILKPILEKLKISVVEIENQPIIQEIKRGMHQFYNM